LTPIIPNYSIILTPIILTPIILKQKCSSRSVAETLRTGLQNPSGSVIGAGVYKFLHQG